MKHKLQEEIEEYMDKKGITKNGLANSLNMHPNSLRQFFTIKGHNSFKIISWYLEHRHTTATLKQFKKDMINQAVEEIVIDCKRKKCVLQKVNDLRKYVESL